MHLLGEQIFQTKKWHCHRYVMHLRNRARFHVLRLVYLNLATVVQPLQLNVLFPDSITEIITLVDLAESALLLNELHL